MNRKRILGFWLIALVWLAMPSCVGGGQKSAKDTLDLAHGLKLDYITKIDSFPVTDDAGGVMMRVSLKHLTAPGNDMLSDAIDKAFLDVSSFSATGYTRTSLLDSLYNQLKETNSGFPDVPAFGDLWYYDYKVSVAYQDDVCLSLEGHNEGYEGGVHGYAYTTYASFDVKQSRRITESEIYVADYNQPLSELIQRKIMADHKVKTLAELSDLGFDAPDEIAPNANFMLTDVGITYCYNQYEIAPYAMGMTIVKLSWEELRPIIRPGSIASHYIL